MCFEKKNRKKKQNKTKQNVSFESSAGGAAFFRCAAIYVQQKGGGGMKERGCKLGMEKITHYDTLNPILKQEVRIPVLTLVINF